VRDTKHHSNSASSAQSAQKRRNTGAITQGSVVTHRSGPKNQATTVELRRKWDGCIGQGRSRERRRGDQPKERAKHVRYSPVVPDALSADAPGTSIDRPGGGNARGGTTSERKLGNTKEIHFSVWCQSQRSDPKQEPKKWCYEVELRSHVNGDGEKQGTPRHEGQSISIIETGRTRNVHRRVAGTFSARDRQGELKDSRKKGEKSRVTRTSAAGSDPCRGEQQIQERCKKILPFEKLTTNSKKAKTKKSRRGMQIEGTKKGKEQRGACPGS